MKAMWSAEVIGPSAAERVSAQRGFPSTDADRRPWVAEITGLSARHGYRRAFLRGRRDWTHANSRGTRGVHVWWTLESGHYYQAWHRISWKDSQTLFLTVTEAGEVVEVEREEVDRWLREKLNVSTVEA